MTIPTVPKLEKVMTIAATIDPPQQVGDDLSIYNVPGGKILGDGFTAAIIAPSADWARPVSASVIGLDVRLSALTETGHYLYLTYSGRVVINDEVAPKMVSGEEIQGSEMYFTTNPVVKTNDPELAWMNDTIFVGRMQRNTMAGANGQGQLSMTSTRSSSKNRPAEAKKTPP